MGSRDILLRNSPSHTRSCSIFLYEVIKISQVCSLGKSTSEPVQSPLKLQLILKWNHPRDLLDSSVSHAFPNRLGTLSASNLHFVPTRMQSGDIQSFPFPSLLFLRTGGKCDVETEEGNDHTECVLDRLAHVMVHLRCGEVGEPAYLRRT